MEQPIARSWPDDVSADLACRIRNPRLTQLLMDWNRWRGRRLMPARRDFLPEDLGYILGHIILHEVAEREPLRFRYRLIGSAITARRGHDMTGRYLDEHPDAEVRAVVSGFNERVVRERRPVLWQFDDRKPHYAMRHCEVLSLPLAANGTDVDIILAAQLFIDEEKSG